MPRIGTNPLKFGSRSHRAQQITLATIVYIPELSGYWSESLDVLKVCLDSAERHTTLPYELMVLDNGSCPEVRRYLKSLHDEGRIHYLILSQFNLGKAAAYNLLFPAAPGDYIGYFDSDVLFYAGWLERTLEIFESFENVGQVTARPARHPVAYEAEVDSATTEYAENVNGETLVERGELIPRPILAEHFRSIGLAEDAAGFPPYDVRLTRNGVSAFAYSADYQFVIPKRVAQDVLPIPVKETVMGSRALQIGVNRAGRLRLSLTEPFVRHLGNSLSGEDLSQLQAEIARNEPARNGAEQARRTPWLARGFRRRVLARLYAEIGKLLYS